ncbi:MAG: endolytic transglycosylase MltG [Clostridia bacterium]|nr:endolytic transglycosylase MltG [Clostridia bacterium]
MKRIVILCLLVVVTAAIILLPYAFEYFATTSNPQGDAVSFEIEKGASVGEIGETLKENGLIRSVNIFKIRVKELRAAESLKYGVFEMQKGLCIPDIVEILSEGGAEADSVRLTIPEGFSVERIAQKVQEMGLCSKDEFLVACNDEYDYEFLNMLPENDGVIYRLQGFLFPDTYDFPKQTTARNIVNTLLSQFEKKIAQTEIDESERPLYDIVTIASLIEREAQLKSEQDAISGVIYNRLNDNMRLQICASVLYVITNGMYDVTEVLYKDLEVDSPYNTYKVAALPCGPICNPGIDAINAAIHPQKHSYFFYHTDENKKDGSHVFTQTYSEHQITQE